MRSITRSNKTVSLIDQLRALREHWTQQELAYLLGCAESTLCRWLKPEGGTKPGLNYRRAIQKLYNQIQRRSKSGSTS